MTLKQFLATKKYVCSFCVYFENKLKAAMFLYGKQQQMPNALIFILQFLINTQAAYNLKLKKQSGNLNSFDGFDENRALFRKVTSAEKSVLQT